MRALHILIPREEEGSLQSPRDKLLEEVLTAWDGLTLLDGSPGGGYWPFTRYVIIAWEGQLDSHDWGRVELQDTKSSLAGTNGMTSHGHILHLSAVKPGSQQFWRMCNKDRPMG